MRKIRENVIVAKGNQAVFASGQPVFRNDGTTNVKPGQLVVWDPKTNLSLGSTITCLTNDLIVISQGTKTGKLRSCFGDVLYGCDVKVINAEGPDCGTADIWDFYIDDNISCNSTFSVTITVKDDDTLNTYPWNKTEAYVYTVDTKDCACTDCETGFDAQKLACKIVNQINNNGYNELPYDKKAYFKKIPNSSTKFTAHVLHAGLNSNIVYCLSPVSGCEGCLDANVLISSMSFGGQTIEFIGLENGEGDATLISRLDSLVRQINDALGENGSAALTGGAGSCCSLRLEINSCYPDFTLYSDPEGTTPIVPCVPANDPFDPQPVDGSCADCAISATALLTFTGQPGLNQTVTVGAKTYTFQSVLTNVDGNVAIGALIGDSINNLIAAVNLGAGSGTAYAAATTLHPTVSAAADIPNTIRFLAKVPGTAGNALVSTETLTNASFGSGTFTGGVAAPASATYKNYTAGFRIIAVRNELVCNPMHPVPNPVSGTGLRKLEVFPTKGFDCGKAKVIHFQKATPPDNLGYHWQWVDFASDNGGRGRGHEPFVRQGYGPLGMPLGRGPEGAVEPVCKELYCSYAIEHSIPYRDQTVYGTQVHPRGTTIVLIPSVDTTTRTEFEAIINSYFPSCDCPIKTSVSCA